VGNSSIGKSYSIEQSIAPLSGLKARLGVYAVSGNNDVSAGADAVTAELARNGVRVLSDEAVAVGPLAVGGLIGNLYPHREWLEVRQNLYAEMRRTPGVEVLVAHRPDEFAAAPSPIRLVLSGHTHCGQIVLPLVGPLETGSDYGTKFLCGVVRDRGKLLVVTAGLGTSHVPLRIGAPSDIWLITIRGPQSPGVTVAD
jgi:predicted MPP superfamily phosphohydrolase